MATGIAIKLRAVSRRYDAFVAGLPEPMKSLATELSLALSGGCSSPAEYYSAPEFYPLLRFPLWLEERYIKDGILTGKEGYGVEAACANLFGYLYIRIQDNVLDEPEQFDSAFLLLGNEFVREFFAINHRLFPSDSVFWEYFRLYWLGTTNNTLWERMQCGGALMEMTFTELTDILPRIGGKLDGAKISIASICLLAGREEDISRYGPVMDRLNIGSQLHNDAVSFIKDLKHEYFTCVIADALGCGTNVFDTSELLANASLGALTGTYLEDWLQYAQVYNREAVTLLDKGELPGLSRYVKVKNGHLTELRDEIIKIKNELLNLD